MMTVLLVALALALLKAADRSRRLLARIHRNLMSAAAERDGPEESDE
jgi:hypothetical protein